MLAVLIFPLLVATIAAQVDHDELLVPKHGHLIRNTRQGNFEANSFGQLIPRRRDQRQGQRFPSNPFLNGQNQGFGNQGFGNQGFGNQGFGNQGFGNQGLGNQGLGNQGFGGQGTNQLGNSNGNLPFPSNPFLNNQNNNNGVQDNNNQDIDDMDDDILSFLNPQTSQTTTTRRNQRITTTSRPSGGLQVTTPNAVPGAETPRTPCEERCLTTPQYNPVCGSDGSNYNNEAQLNCAISCGKNVRLNHLGQCTARQAN